jgi:hypothetical protein
LSVETDELDGDRRRRVWRGEASGDRRRFDSQDALHPRRVVPKVVAGVESISTTSPATPVRVRRRGSAKSRRAHALSTMRGSRCRARPASSLVIVGAAGDEEGAAEEAVMDGVQLDAPFVLSLFQLVGAEQFGEGVLMSIALVDPRFSDRGELLGAVGVIDVDEPGPLEELPVGEVGGDGDRTVPMRPAAQAGCESGRGIDREERGTSTGAEEMTGCSQHGELRPQSTQHIGVHHGIEGGRPQR